MQLDLPCATCAGSQYLLTAQRHGVGAAVGSPVVGFSVGFGVVGVDVGIGVGIVVGVSVGVSVGVFVGAPVLGGSSTRSSSLKHVAVLCTKHACFCYV